MKIAALDFGSNTTLLLVCDVENGRVTEVYCDETRVTKMGQGVHESKEFQPQALERVRQALEDYRTIIQNHNVERTFAVATSAARDVKNSQKLFDLAKSFGIQIEVISGVREAELTFLGAFAQRVEPKNCCVVDIGGGSTEVISRVDQVVRGESVDIGSVRLMDLFGKEDPMPMASVLEMRKYIQSKMQGQWQGVKAAVAIGVAGTPSILACMQLKEDFIKEHVDGFILKAKDVEKWVETLQPMDVDQRSRIPGLPEKRADVILAGTVILSEVLKHLKVEEIQVSTYGIRYGVALAYAQNN